MGNQAFAISVRSHLQNGEIAEAISVFKAAIEAEKSHAQPLRMLRVIESNFHLARQNVQKGILSHSEARQEYARATDAVLGLLDTVSGEKRGEISTENKLHRGLWFGIGLAGLVFLGILFFYKNYRIGCPDFDGTKEIKVLILPFYATQGAQNAKPHALIRDQINQLAAKNNLSFTAEIQENFNASEELPGKTKALQLAERCGADLIIWGKFIQPNDTTLKVQMDFASVKTDRVGQSEFRTSFFDGNMDRELNEAVFGVCARVAGLLGNNEVAARWLGKVKKPDFEEQEVLKKLSPTN